MNSLNNEEAASAAEIPSTAHTTCVKASFKYSKAAVRRSIKILCKTKESKYCGAVRAYFTSISMSPIHFLVQLDCHFFSYSSSAVQEALRLQLHLRLQSQQ